MKIFRERDWFDFKFIHCIYDVIKINHVIDSRNCQCQRKIKSYISNESTHWEESNDMYYNIKLAKLAKIYTIERRFLSPVSKYGHSLVTWLDIFRQIFFFSECQINFMKSQSISGLMYQPFLELQAIFQQGAKNSPG